MLSPKMELFEIILTVYNKLSNPESNKNLKIRGFTNFALSTLCLDSFRDVPSRLKMETLSVRKKKKKGHFFFCYIEKDYF